MNCAECSADLPRDARFCPRCGAAVPVAEDPELDPLRETLRIALGRQYEIVRLLGRGGMGAVYLARETALERHVAIKVLPPESGSTPESRERFRREARTAARLTHPHIVPLHTFGDVDGTLFFVMGYVKGESLASKLKREGALEAEEGRRILLEVADALDYAHKLGIVHRDIKPDNVLIDEESGRAMLTDFGVAKAAGSDQSLTMSGHLVGTPHYMSPEQAEGSGEIDHRSDIYSLGVTAYAMFSGRLPFQGSSVRDILLQHLTKTAPPLESVAAGVPPEIASAVRRCLAKRPDDRWENARALRTALALDEELPPILEGLQGMVMSALVPLLLLFAIFTWWLGGGDVTAPPLVIAATTCAFFSFIFAAVFAAKCAELRRSGFDWTRIRYEALKQPKWWTGPYPRQYRGRGDVWDRLPPALRRARTAMSVGLLFSLACTIWAVLLREAFDSYAARIGHPPYSRAVVNGLMFTLLAAAVAVFSIALIGMARWEREAKNAGLSDPHLRARATGASTSRRTFWGRPDIASILAPPGEAALPQTALSDAVTAARTDHAPTVKT